MAQSHIQSKKQGNKNSIGIWGWMQRTEKKRGGGQTLKNGSMQYRGFLKKIGALGTLCPLSYKITQNISKNIHIDIE